MMAHDIKKTTEELLKFVDVKTRNMTLHSSKKLIDLRICLSRKQRNGCIRPLIIKFTKTTGFLNNFEKNNTCRSYSKIKKHTRKLSLILE